MNAACAWLEARLRLLEGPLTIGQIAIGCALGYFDLRFPEDHWQTAYASLARWHAAFEERPSMAATRYEVLKRTLPTHLIKEGPSRR